MRSYYSLRARMAPQPSTLPGVLLGILALVTVFGVFANIAAISL